MNLEQVYIVLELFYTMDFLVVRMKIWVWESMLTICWIALKSYPIDRNKHKQQDQMLNTIELKAFRSFNSLIGWLLISISIFGLLYSIYLQKKSPKPLVKYSKTQINWLRFLKKLSTLSMWKYLNLAILFFADSSRKTDYDQLF